MVGGGTPQAMSRNNTGQWLINQVKDQSHHAELTVRYTMKIEDTEVLGRQGAKPSKIKA